MSKFLNIFGTKSSASTKTSKAKAVEGRLETDALPVDEADATNSNANGYQTHPLSSSTTTTPSASADMTADVVRELTDPNYNSMREVVPTGVGALNTLPNGGNEINSLTSNTMNVHNAQQQLVMQFSNVNQLHFGSVYNFNSNLTANNSRKSSTVDETAAAADINGAGIIVGAVTEPTKRQTPRKTTSVVAMMQSQEEPDHRMLDTVATHLGEGWKLVMRNLGHSEGQIEQAIIDHQMHGGIKEVIYQLLLQWLRNADDGEATISRLTTLLWEMQHRECVQRMKLVFKSNPQRKASR